MSSLFSNEEIENTIDTLSEISKSDEGDSVIKSDYTLYKYDSSGHGEKSINKLVTDKYRSNKPTCAANGLYIKDDNNIYLLEFKNTSHQHVDKKHIKCKAYDNILPLLLTFFPKYSLEDIKQKVTYFVIYNDDVKEGKTRKFGKGEYFNKFIDNQKDISNKKDLESILWGLEDYINVFYKDVHTIDKSVFIDKYMDIIFDKKQQPAIV